MPATLEPSPTAEGILGLMVDRDDVQRTILEETLASAAEGQILESGRTLCSSQTQIRGPLERFPRAVDLQQCPISGGGGAWHTHVTPKQLMTPENSLPDIGSVVFGQLDVIAVVGADSAEYVMAADDREAMVQEFRDAIGADIQEQSQLVSAIRSGRIQPVTARRRVRQRMGNLFTTQQTGFSDLSTRVRDMFQTTAKQPDESYESVELAMLHHKRSPGYADGMAHPLTANEVTGRMGESAEQTISNVIPESVRSTAIGAAVGTVVGNIVNSLFFD
jgi:hypothetical protein